MNEQEREPREVWLPENEDGTLGAVAYRSKGAAESNAPCAVRIVRFVEADLHHS